MRFHVVLISFYTGSIKDAIQICDRKTASIRPRVCVNSWKLSLSLTSGTLLPDVLHRTFYGVLKISSRQAMLEV